VAETDLRRLMDLHGFTPEKPAPPFQVSIDLRAKAVE
jgi:hypothetical protein